MVMTYLSGVIVGFTMGFLFGKGITIKKYKDKEYKR